MLGMLPVLGVHAFEKAQRSATPLPLIVVPPPVATPATPIRLPAQVVLTSKADVELMCSGKGYEAHGSDTAQGFMVWS